MISLRKKLSTIHVYQKAHDIKMSILNIDEKRNELLPIIHKLKQNKNAAIYLFTPTHTNLGDHAIALATIELFNKAKIDYIEITDKELFSLQKYNKLKLFNKRKILFHGGGYLGTLWFRCELLSRSIVLSNPKSEIVFLPNTIFYEKNEEGNRELQKSIDIYNSHSNLTFYAREIISYKCMKEIYNNVKICPDMVLSLNKTDRSVKRNGCLICFRSDCEKTLNDEDKKTIINQAIVYFNDSIIETDMYAEEEFDIKFRSDILEKKFNQFRQSKLVITDRLHGMIFSAITETPCIVVNSKSHKLKGCYEWIKDLNYIFYCDDLSCIQGLIGKILNSQRVLYDNSAFVKMYDELIENIK